jgi:P27 family predicted phage terminase small subunit
MPPHLSPEMKKFFKKIMTDFDLDTHHVTLLTKACECLDRAEEARQMVTADGLTTTDRYGSIKPHPCCKLELDYKASARMLLRELGLDLEPPEPGKAPRLY